VTTRGKEPSQRQNKKLEKSIKRARVLVSNYGGKDETSPSVQREEKQWKAMTGTSDLGGTWGGLCKRKNAHPVAQTSQTRRGRPLNDCWGGGNGERRRGFGFLSLEHHWELGKRETTGGGGGLQ